MKGKKLEEIAIERLHTIIDNGGTQSDYDRGLDYIKDNAEYPNEEIMDKISRHSKEHIKE